MVLVQDSLYDGVTWIWIVMWNIRCSHRFHDLDVVVEAIFTIDIWTSGESRGAGLLWETVG